jgi:hypothetical protein
MCSLLTAQLQQKAPAVAGLTSASALEIQRFSGDFQEWTEILTIHSPQALTLRWKTTIPAATAGIWQLRAGPFAPTSASPLSAQVLASGPLPTVTPGGNAMPFTVDLKKVITAPPQNAARTYYIRAIPMDAGQQPLGKTFPSVRIVYAKAAGGSRIQLDTLAVTAFAPSSGTLEAVPAGATLGVLNNTNSIGISYSVELKSQAVADVRQWLLLADGSVAAGNFWSWTSVNQGKSATKNRATIKCETPGQKPTVIAAIGYKLTHVQQGVLAEGVQPIPGGITFTCPQGKQP